MARGPYSGEDVVKVMVNHGPFYLDRINGDHAILKWDPPAHHNSDARTVPVPLHDELSTGTLRNIADLAGAKNLQDFKDWLDRNL